MKECLVGLVVTGALGFAAAGQAQTIEVIYTKITGHPTAVVPGALDLAGNPEFIEFRDIRGISVAPNGTDWLLDATTQVGAVTQSNRDSIYLKGSGTTGTMFLQEGQPAVGGNVADYISFMPSGFGKFNENGEIAIGIRARLVQDGTTSSPNPSDGQRVLRWSPSGGFSLALKQGDPYSGATVSALVGNSMASFHLLNDGRVGVADTTVNGSSTVHILSYTSGVSNPETFKQRNVSAVLGLDGTTVHTWGGFTSLNPTEFYTTPDGAHWFAKGTIQGAATSEDTIFAYDGRVRLREGHVIPGSSPAITVGDITQYFAVGNHWIARGRDNSGTSAAAPDFVVVNGNVVAATGMPIMPGSTETWGDTIQAVSINGGGNYVIVGNTNNPDAGRDNVMVYNSAAVLAREGDMVDLNGNGLPDDDAFLGRASGFAFDANDTHIGNENMVYFIGFLKNGAGVDLGITPTAFLGPQAFMRVLGDIPLICGTSDFNGDGDFGTDADIEDFFACLSGNCCPTCFAGGSDFNGDGDFGTDMDIEAFFRVLAGGPCWP